MRKKGDQLDGAQVEKLKKALLKAYPTEESLKQMVKMRLNQNLAEISGGITLDDKVFNLIMWAEGKGKVADLVAKAHEYNPSNPELLVFHDNFFAPAVTSVSITLQELIVQKESENWAQIIRRDDILAKLKHCLTEDLKKLIILYGQPMTGKSQLLKRLSHSLSDEYIPLYVTLHVGNSSPDGFLLHLAVKLARELNDWSKCKNISFELDDPLAFFKEIRQVGGAVQTAFELYWNALQEAIGTRQTIVIIDEVESLLDYPNEYFDAKIDFLKDFVCDPKNGLFVLAGSERIRNSNNKKFDRMIDKADDYINVPHYDEETVISVFSAIQDYLDYEDDTIQYFLATLCDGHLKFLSSVIDALNSCLLASGRQELKRSDSEYLITEIIKKHSNHFEVFRKRLSLEERTVVWLVSRRISNPMDSFEFSLYELQWLADQHLTDQKVTSARLRHGVIQLENREWIEFRDDNKDPIRFRFKPGIFAWWFHHHHYSFNQVVI